MKKIQNIYTNGKYFNQGWNRLASRFKPVHTVNLVDERLEDQEEGGRRHNICAQNRRFA
jgi:hypothetical protein